ncbi:hypothetical protein [Streptomyces sp. NPDC005209]|uniref:hypothetical protein n=1 Tax=Streptomyces sp. NPDC005209 TaxID=3156715 RepID=UPI0033B9646F
MCLSSYLTGAPDLDAPAEGFFELQRLVVDAAWTVPAGGDAARLDATNNAEMPEDVRRRRSIMEQVIGAALVDRGIVRAFGDVRFHPATPRHLG